MNLVSAFSALFVLVVSHFAVYASPVDAGSKGKALHHIVAREDPPTSVPVNFASGEGACNEEQKKVIRVEMSWAFAMAEAARDDTEFGDYFNHFFSENLRRQNGFGERVKERYRRIADSKQNINQKPYLVGDYLRHVSSLLTHEFPFTSSQRQIIGFSCHGYLQPRVKRLQEKGMVGSRTFRRLLRV